jgi:hypothetical protein
MSLHRFNLILAFWACSLLIGLYASPKVTGIGNIVVDGQVGELVKSYTKEFDDRSNNSLFRSHYRSITISIGAVEPKVMAIAAVGVLSCEITLSDAIPWQYLEPIYLRSTIIHEILHCMGVGHSEDPTNVMYANHDEKINEASITNALVLLDNRAHF